ncbi:hypothetical protein EYW47_00875 [Paraburkholderia silviterrae]|uniref:Resolvase HTH domain-containing protein n=1 Tax=Paraburkholderia silviterrae TaxID=2528715 RepID=A0A4R5MGQ8_9BURK|nr:hypothetical protein EYW47_00875 [Paraburkholderia silviterrae]
MQPQSKLAVPTKANQQIAPTSPPDTTPPTSPTSTAIVLSSSTRRGTLSGTHSNRNYRGRKKSLADSEIAGLQQRAAAGEQNTTLARGFGISRETLYQYLRAPE